MWTRIGVAWSRLLDVIAPRHCVMCHRRLTLTEDPVCTSCLASLPFTKHRLSPYDNEMARLYWGLVPIEKAAALMKYEAGSEAAQIVYHMKYEDDPEIGRAMGRKMAQMMKRLDFFNDIDALVPIPLAKVRQRQRGYNQSEYLAMGISEVTGLPIAKNALLRKIFEKSQTRLSHFDRRSNVENAFIPGPRLEDYANRHLLLVDDVVTTGATSQECMRTLLQSQPSLKLSIIALGFAH